MTLSNWETDLQKVSESLLFLAVIGSDCRLGQATECIGTATNHNLTSFVDSRYLTDKGCVIHYLL